MRLFVLQTARRPTSAGGAVMGSRGLSALGGEARRGGAPPQPAAPHDQWKVGGAIFSGLRWAQSRCSTPAATRFCASCRCSAAWR